jgi:hypothetical protein
LKAILQSTQLRSHDPGESEGYSREQRALELRYELEMQNRLNQEIKEIEERAVAKFESSTSWRITAPLRRVSSALRSFVVQQPRV